MAATATQQIIHNGTRNLVLKYTIAGTSGDTLAGRLVDVSALDSNIGLNGLRLERATWSLTGFSCKLMWDGAPDADLLEMSDGDGVVDYSDIGGIPNNSVNQSGDVMFRTTDYGASGEGASFILEFKKRRTASLTADVPGNLASSPSVGSLGLAGQEPSFVLSAEFSFASGGSMALAGAAPTVTVA